MNCLFCKIVQGEVPAQIVYEDSDLMAFRDINPQAPTHVLVIPKKHISTVNEACDDDAQLLGTLILRSKKIAQTEGLTENGYRLVFNINQHGGQTVYHIHLHILGGRPMDWPPG